MTSLKNPAQTGKRQKPRLFRIIGLLAIIAIPAAVLIYPAVAPPPKPAKQARAKSICVSLVVGVSQFQAEYGVYPDFGAKGDTKFITVPNDKLMDLLRANPKRPFPQNVRKIPFFVYKDAKRITGKWCDGYAPSGELMDPWGNPYRIVYDTDGDGQVTARGEVVKAGVAVYSIGKDGVEGPGRHAPSDDVLSWR